MQELRNQDEELLRPRPTEEESQVARALAPNLEEAKQSAKNAGHPANVLALQENTETGQQLFIQDEEMVHVIEDDDAAASSVQHGSKWRRRLLSGKRSGIPATAPALHLCFVCKSNEVLW